MSLARSGDPGVIYLHTVLKIGDPLSHESVKSYGLNGAKLKILSIFDALHLCTFNPLRA